MAIQQIISGGQTGADRAGLDAAIETVDVLMALEYAARKRLGEFIDVLEKNIGIPSIRRVSYRNGSLFYSPEEAVAVEFLQYGAEVQP